MIRHTIIMNRATLRQIAALGVTGCILGFDNAHVTCRLFPLRWPGGAGHAVAVQCSSQQSRSLRYDHALTPVQPSGLVDRVPKGETKVVSLSGNCVLYRYIVLSHTLPYLNDTV